MGLLSLFPKKENITSSFDFEFDYHLSNRGYLKMMALETVIGYVARAIAMSEFKYSRNGYRIRDATDFSLNVRPNSDQSAFEFWYEFTFKLIHDGNVLAIFSDTGDMIIADSFTRNTFALYPDTFSDVTIGDYTYQRSFSIEDVIYLEYGNSNLSSFMDGMFADYTDLFNRMIENQKITNQFRAKVDIDATINTTKEQQEKTQSRIDKMFSTIREKAIAILPVTKGFDYTELYNGTGSSPSSSVEAITSLKTSLMNEVADILGVPQALLHGDIADMDSLIKSFVKFCIQPLNKMIEDELNAKIIGRDDYLNGERIKVQGIRIKDITESADAVDKLVASGVFNRNEVRQLFGEDKSDNEDLDVYVITKNYATNEEINNTTGNEG